MVTSLFSHKFYNKCEHRYILSSKPYYFYLFDVEVYLLNHQNIPFPIYREKDVINSKLYNINK